MCIRDSDELVTVLDATLGSEETADRWLLKLDTWRLLELTDCSCRSPNLKTRRPITAIKITTRLPNKMTTPWCWRLLISFTLQVEFLVQKSSHLVNPQTHKMTTSNYIVIVVTLIWLVLAFLYDVDAIVGGQTTSLLSRWNKGFLWFNHWSLKPKRPSLQCQAKPFQVTLNIFWQANYRLRPFPIFNVAISTT